MPKLRLATKSIGGERDYQEDSVLTEELSDGRTLVAVADGMGGHAAGDVASSLAVEALVDGLEEDRSLDESFHLANERVWAEAQEPDKKGMGTTLTAMLLDGGSYQLANVGDSRAYLVSEEEVRQLTADHSFAAEAQEQGVPEETIQASQWRNALTRAIGTEEEVEVDLFGPYDVAEATAILICSDGLYKTLSESDIREIFLGSGGPDGAAQSLVTSALEEGSDDNISVAIAEFGEVPRAEPMGTVPLEQQATSEEEPADEPTEAAAGQSADAEEVPPVEPEGAPGGGAPGPSRGLPEGRDLSTPLLVGGVLAVVALIALLILLV